MDDLMDGFRFPADPRGFQSACYCRCRLPTEDRAGIMRRTADVDADLLRTAEIRALTNPSS